MKNKFFAMVAVCLTLASCGCPEDSDKHKFEVGQDVHIKHKTFHNDATVTEQLRDDDCSCMYEISYYSTLGVRRHRVVKEVEIEASTSSGVIDEIKEILY